MFSFIKDNVVKHTITYLGFTKWTEIVGHLDMVKVTKTWDGRSIFLTEFVFDLKASFSMWQCHVGTAAQHLRKFTKCLAPISWSKDHKVNLNLILSRTKS